MTLKLDPNNARKHNDKNRAMIADSFDRFGPVRPIVVGKDENGDDVVYAGNATYQAAVDAGIPVDIIETDGTKLYAVRAEHLTTEQLREYGLIDNQSALLSSWDTDELRRRLENGEDLSAAWPDSEELSQLLYPDSYIGTGGDGDSDGDDKDTSPQEIPEKYLVIVECDGEDEQLATLDDLEAQGYTCRVIVS